MVPDRSEPLSATPSLPLVNPPSESIRSFRRSRLSSYLPFGTSSVTRPVRITFGPSPTGTGFGTASVTGAGFAACELAVEEPSVGTVVKRELPVVEVPPMPHATRRQTAMARERPTRVFTRTFFLLAGGCRRVFGRKRGMLFLGTG